MSLIFSSNFPPQLQNGLALCKRDKMKWLSIVADVVRIKVWPGVPRRAWDRLGTRDGKIRARRRVRQNGGGNKNWESGKIKSSDRRGEDRMAAKTHGTGRGRRCALESGGPSRSDLCLHDWDETPSQPFLDHLP